MTRRPVIHNWSWQRLFGQHVLVGVVEDRWVCVLLRYKARDRFGISRGAAGAEEVWTVGRPGLDAWGLRDEPGKQAVPASGL